MPFVGRTGLTEEVGEILQQQVQADSQDGPRGDRRGYQGAAGWNARRRCIAALLPGVGPVPNPHREGREDQDNEDDPCREDAEGRQTRMVRGQRLVVCGYSRADRLVSVYSPCLGCLQAIPALPKHLKGHSTRVMSNSDQGLRSHNMVGGSHGRVPGSQPERVQDRGVIARQGACSSSSAAWRHRLRST